MKSLAEVSDLLPEEVEVLQRFAGISDLELAGVHHDETGQV